MCVTGLLKPKKNTNNINMVNNIVNVNNITKSNNTSSHNNNKNMMIMIVYKQYQNQNWINKLIWHIRDQFHWAAWAQKVAKHNKIMPTRINPAKIPSLNHLSCIFLVIRKLFCIIFGLKTLDTVGNCQSPVISLVKPVKISAQLVV